MRKVRITLILLITCFTLARSQDHEKPLIFFGIGVSYNLFANQYVQDLYNNSPYSITGSIPVSAGFVLRNDRQFQVEYYFEDYFQNSYQFIRYNGIVFGFPISSIVNAKALRISYGKRLKAGNCLITPKGGITFGFLGELYQTRTEIQRNIDGVNYTTKSEVTKFNSFHPYMALGFDFESPRFLKKVSALLNGNYNLAIDAAIKNDISLDVDGVIMYANNLSKNLNHGNMMVGLRYYFSP